MLELNGENYLDGHEAAHLLGVKIATLYTYVSRGVLKSYKRGIKRQSLYKQTEIEALLRLRPSGSQDDEGTSVQSSGSPALTVELPLAEEWVSNV